MDLNKLIDELCLYKYDKEWFEFKENFDNDSELGKYSLCEGQDYI